MAACLLGVLMHSLPSGCIDRVSIHTRYMNHHSVPRSTFPGLSFLKTPL